MKKFLKSLGNYSYWKSYIYEKRLKDALKIFFKEEDKELQELFLKNFSYPTNMTTSPVRLSEEGDIYYVINFKSKELFENEGTIQAAFMQSISILGQNLPLGTTEYLNPEIIGRVDTEYTVLISVTPTYEAIKPLNVFLNILKHFVPLAALISIITFIIIG